MEAFRSRRQRGAVIVLIVMSGTTLALIVWMAWGFTAAVVTYFLAVLAATLLLLGGIKAEAQAHCADEWIEAEDVLDR